MPFVIVRRSENDGSEADVGLYEERAEAVAAMPAVLAQFKKSGRGKHGDEQDYWWAHDDHGQGLRFTIRSR